MLCDFISPKKTKLAKWKPAQLYTQRFPVQPSLYTLIPLLYTYYFSPFTFLPFTKVYHTIANFHRPLTNQHYLVLTCVTPYKMMTGSQLFLRKMDLRSIFYEKNGFRLQITRPFTPPYFENKTPQKFFLNNTQTQNRC